MRRSYGQYCALTRALDRVGDRWTLPIVRELLIGPRRYSDLRRSLPGIASNLLAARLRDLEADGIVRKREVAPPTPAVVYELTHLGAGLEEAVLALVRWGGRFLDYGEDDAFDPRWLVLPLRALIRPGPQSSRWEFHVGGEVIHVHIDRGRCEVGMGPLSAADLVLECDPRTLLSLVSGAVPLDVAESKRLVSVLGSQESRERFSAAVATDARVEDGSYSTASASRST